MGKAKTISTKQKSFNEIAHLVKKIPATKKFNGKTYQRFTSSFSEWAINTEIKRMKAAKGTLGSRTMVRKVVYRRAGRNVYTAYYRNVR